MAERWQKSRRLGVAVLAVAVASATGCTVRQLDAAVPAELSEFCDAYGAAAAGSLDTNALASDVGLELGDGVVAITPEILAAPGSVGVGGEGCTDPNAAIELDDVALADTSQAEKVAEAVAATRSAPAPEPAISPEMVQAAARAAAPPGLAQGIQLAEGLRLISVSAAITNAGITIKGRLGVVLAGEESIVEFNGRLSAVDTWQLDIASDAFVIPGVTTQPVAIVGSIASQGGAQTVALSADAPSLEIGGVVIRRAHFDLQGDGSTYRVNVAGNAKVGPSSVAAKIAVTLTADGRISAIEGRLRLNLEGTLPNGNLARLDGVATLASVGDTITASFNGTGKFGNIVVSELNGTLTMSAGRVVVLDGIFDISSGATVGRFKGSVRYDRSDVTMPVLTAEGRGDFSGTLPNGDYVRISGSVATTIADGVTTARVNGDFTFGQLVGSGRADVVVSGRTARLTLDGSVSLNGSQATVSGTAVMRDGALISLDLNGRFRGTVVIGQSAIVGGTFTVSATNDGVLVSATATVTAPGTLGLDAQVTLSLNNRGQVISARGSATGRLQIDGWLMTDLRATFTATRESTTINGSVNVNAGNIVGARFAGTLTVSNLTQSWVFTGSGTLSIGGFTIAGASFEINRSDGMRALGVQLQFSVLFIPKWVNMDISLNAQGGCRQGVITGGSLLGVLDAQLFFGPLLGCRIS